jgi:hypothetical protein
MIPPGKRPTLRQTAAGVISIEQEPIMRRWTPFVVILALVIGLIGALSPHGREAESFPRKTPTALRVTASPPAVVSPASPTPAAKELAQTVTSLQATVAAQQVDIADVTIRLDELETNVATLVDLVPDQVALDGFQNDQLNDLMARWAEVEAQLSATPTPSPTAPSRFVGTWRITETGSAPGTLGVLALTADGTVTAVGQSGRTGLGVWASSGPGTAIATWIEPGEIEPGIMGTTEVQTLLVLDATGTSFQATSTAIQRNARGTLQGTTHGTVTGTRLVVSGVSPDASPTSAP